MPEFLYIKVAGPESATLFVLKREFSASVYLWILRNFSEDLPLKKICKQLLLEMLFLYNISERLLLYFRGFNLCAEKILEFPVKPPTLLTARLF